MDSMTLVLVGGLENPIVTSDKVAVRHDIFRRTFSQQNRPQIRSFLCGLNVVKPIVNLFKTQKVEVSRVDIR